MSWYLRRSQWIVLACVSMALVIGCSKQSQSKIAKTQPAGDATSDGSSSAVSTPSAATKPAESGEPVQSRPAPTKPASTYDSRPPYPVKLYVLSPDEEQPGWIKILEMVDQDVVAVAEGTFPKKNSVYINTTNVQRVRIHIAHLPLTRGKRTVLHIDDQSMQLTTKDREFVILERGSAGLWGVVRPEN